MNKNVNIIWYGRCCFLVILNNKRILFDPYDTYCGVDIGYIDAEIVVSSSTWHDHGHIGAVPGAWLYTYSGIYNNSGITINGIEAKEERGTPTIVFNIKYEDLSITNFADLGTSDLRSFEKGLSEKELNVLAKTNIAFVRPGHEEVLKYCNPAFIFPEHYFPRYFIEEQIPHELRQDFEIPNMEVDKMLNKLGYTVQEVDGYKYNVELDEKNDHTRVIKLLKIHPQVKYEEKFNIKRYW